MKCRIYLIFIVAAVILSMCRKEDDLHSVIHPDFQIYVDRFIIEAAARGVQIDIGELKVSYSDTLEYYCGYGNYTNEHLQISSRPGCWLDLTDCNKEILMFHELGHTLLKRSHDNSTLPNGDFKTIMFRGNQFYLYNKYTPERRKYYLDELFNPLTPQPDWSAEKNVPTVIFKDSINAASNSWKYNRTANSSQNGELCSSIFLSPGTSLAIKSNKLSEFSYWSYEFIPQGIKQSTKLVLFVNIKLDDVTDGGVYIALRGDSDSEMIFFHTTQGVKEITGTSDFIEYSVEVPYYISSITKTRIFLILDGSALGSAYFDDVTLINYE